MSITFNILTFHNNIGVKVAFIESYETNPQLSRVAFLYAFAYFCEWWLSRTNQTTIISPRLQGMNILRGSMGSSGEDLLKRQTLDLRFESILLQYGLPPNLETNHKLLSQKHLL